MSEFPTDDERRAEAQRLLEGLSGQWVATRMGVSKATVRLWRRGDRVPDLEDLLRLPEATGRPLDAGLAARIQARLSGKTDEPVPVKEERAV